MNESMFTFFCCYRSRFVSLQIDLMEAFRRGDLGDFVYALEFFNANVNEVKDAGLTIFQKILLTPNSGDYIKSCINNGADRYGV